MLSVLCHCGYLWCFVCRVGDFSILSPRMTLHVLLFQICSTCIFALSRYYEERYDFRANVFDWDLNMKVKKYNIH